VRRPRLRGVVARGGGDVLHLLGAPLGGRSRLRTRQFNFLLRRTTQFKLQTQQTEG